MKNFLIIFIFLMIALGGYSQTDSTTNKDSVIRNLPARQVRNAIRAKDSLELMKTEVVLWQRIGSLYETLSQKDSTIISKADELNVSNGKLIDNLKFQNQNLSRQQETMEKWNHALSGIIKKKNWIIGISATVIGGLTYLLIHK